MRRSVSNVSCVLAFALAAVGCGSESEPNTMKNIDRLEMPASPFAPTTLETTINGLVDALNNTTEQTFDVSVVLKPLNTGYWTPVQVGANRALAELKIGGQVETPIAAAEDTAEIINQKQADLLRQRVTDGYKGLGLAPNQAALKETVDAAEDAEVPVVLVDSDIPDSKRSMFIGTNSAAAGRTAGQTLASLIPETSGTVFVLGTDSPDWVDGYARSFAAKQALEEAGFTVVVHRVGWGPSTIQADFDVLTEAVPNAVPPTVGMLGVFSNAYRCAEVAQKVGLAPGQIKIAAFDFEASTLQFMADGYIQATHAQRQYYMGYLVPYALFSINVLGLDKTTDLLGQFMGENHSFDTGLDVVMADQLDDFNNFLDSVGIGG